ncbi:MAG TPA: TonB-dependent receptor [Bryobacteraceae bacterium]|nr:TonB-dependent receptor [Bryobacteraceae bacterium]
MQRMLLLAALVVLVAVPNCFGQAAAINGQIEGTVTDPTGAVVPGAAVSIENVNTGFKRELKTDDSGFFRFTVLPLGTYNLKVVTTGFSPGARNGVVIDAGATATVDIQLRVGGTAEVVDVTSASPVVEPGRTDLGSMLTQNSIENLPLVSRNPYNFILVQPNASARPNTEFGVPRKINANGFTDRINYELDGSNNTQSDRAGIRLLPISDTFIGEVQQVNNGFAPEFGNTSGTFFNAITKSGTNGLHGEAAYIFGRSSLNAKPAFAPLAPKPDRSLDSYIADAGGRIIKDKLFWFGAFEHDSRSLPTAISVAPATLTQLGLPTNLSNPIPFGQSVYFYMGKADWQINQSNRLSGRFNYFRNESPFNNGGGQTLATQTYLFKDRAPVGAVQLISTISPNMVNEFRFAIPKRFQRQVAFEGTGPQPAITVSGVANFGGSPQTGVAFTEKTPQWSDNLSYTRGTHTYKFGVDIRYILDNQTQQQFAQYTFGSINAYLDAKAGTNPKSYSNFQQTFGNPAVIYSSVFTGMYVQDNWKIRPNLTLTYGVRYDIYKIPSADTKSLFATSQKFNVDKNNFAPRVGIAYSIGKDQKTVVRANYGVFYDAPQTNVYFNALLNNGAPQVFNLSTNSSSAFAPAFPTVLSSLPSGFNLPTQDVFTVSPNFRTLYTSNANLQITREIASNMSLSVGYLFTKGTHLPVFRNINAVPTGNFLADGRPILKTGAIFTQFNNIYDAESVGNSNYNALNVTLNRRFSKGYEFFLTYTWSHALDDAPERNILDSSNLMPEDPTNRSRDYGNSFSDRRNALTGTGVLHPHFDVTGPMKYFVNNNQMSFILEATSGDIFNIGSNRNLNGDPTVPASLQRPLFIGRDTYRGPAIYEFNMRYSRIFPVTERIRPEFLAEFGNLFNHANFAGGSATGGSAINTVATVDAAGNILSQPSFQRINSIMDPRFIQFGFRLSF